MSAYEVDGKVLGVRSLRADFTSYGGFANPTEVNSEVFAPDWDEVAECGKGLHFVPWGLGHEGQDLGTQRPVWQVVEPIGVVVDLDGKCKARGLRVLHTGTLAECMNKTHEGRVAFSKSRANGAEKSTGDSSSAASTGYSSSAASTGYRSSAASTGDSSSAASTGYRSSAASTGDSSSAASTGDISSAASTGYSSSAASTGYSSSAASTGDSSSAASTGDRSSAASTGDSSSAASTGDSSSAASTGYSSSAASTGYRSSAASTGNCSASVVTGVESRAMAGPYGCIALAFCVTDERSNYVRDEMRCARIGCGDGSDGMLKANVWYELGATGEFVEVPS